MPSAAIQVRQQHNAWRFDVNSAVLLARPLAPLIDAVCRRCGDESGTCDALRAAWAIARTETDEAHRALDVYDETGRGARAVDLALRRAGEACEAVVAAFKATQDLHGGDDGPRLQVPAPVMPVALPTAAPRPSWIARAVAALARQRLVPEPLPLRIGPVHLGTLEQERRRRAVHPPKETAP